MVANIPVGMKVVYMVDWNRETPRTMRCEGFEELEYGVVLYDADGEEIGYVSHENLVAIEPE